MFHFIVPLSLIIEVFIPFVIISRINAWYYLSDPKLGKMASVIVLLVNKMDGRWEEGLQIRHKTLKEECIREGGGA